MMAGEHRIYVNGYCVQLVLDCGRWFVYINGVKRFKSHMTIEAAMQVATSLTSTH